MATAVLLLGIYILQTCAAKTVFVSNKGTDTHPCSSKATACLTIAFAAQELLDSHDPENDIYIDGEDRGSTVYNGTGEVRITTNVTLLPWDKMHPVNVECAQNASICDFNSSSLFSQDGANTQHAATREISPSSVSVRFHHMNFKYCTFCSQDMPFVFTNTNHSHCSIQVNADTANSLFMASSTSLDTQIVIASVLFWEVRPLVNVTFQDMILQGRLSQLQCNLTRSDVNIRMENVLFKSLQTPVEIYSGHDLNITMENVTFTNAHVQGKCLEINMGPDSRPLVYITDSKFLNNNCSMGGALTFHSATMRNSQLKIDHSVFQNNSGHGCGSGLKVISNEAIGTLAYLTIKDTSFIGNTNTEAAAGVYIENAMVLIERCEFEDNAVRTGSIIVSNLEDRKGSGGALYLNKDATAIVDQCHFINNTANWFGGSLSSSGNLTIYNSTFTNLKNTSVVALGDMLYITGPTYYDDLTFNISTSYPNWALVWYSSEDATFVGHNGGHIQFQCPSGAQFHNESLQARSSPSIEYQHLFFVCNPCPEGSYSMQRGFMEGFVSFGNISYSQDFACHNCPYGGYCHKGWVTSTRNFWGHHKPQSSEISFQACPPGYCCNQSHCDTYHTCSNGRYGTLCGRCRPGLSEQFFTAECRPNSECHDAWYLAIDLLCAAMYILIFMYQQEISCFFMYTFLGITKTDDPGVAATAYIKTIFYFYQVVELLQIAGSGESPVPAFSLQPFISFLFTFRPVMALFNNCPFPDLTPVKKIGLGLVPMVMSVFLLSILSIINKVYEHHKRTHMHQSICIGPKSDGTPDFQIRLAVAFINIFLYGYINLAMSALTLLACVPAGGHSVLYIDGHITCMTPWQYVVLVLFLLLVAPFFMAVICSRDLLESGGIGFTQFFLSYLLPFPMLIYWFAKWVHAKYRTRRYGVEVAPLHGFLDSQHHSSERLKSAILYLIEEPYVKKNNPEESVVYWEGVLLFRRLCLCIVASLVVNPLLSRTLHTLLSLFFLIWHLVKLPFSTKAANHMETSSLTALVVIAIIHLIKATYFAAGQQPLGPHVLQVQISAWLEWSLENAFPILILIALIVFVARQIIRKISHHWKMPVEAPFIHLNNGKPD